MGDTSFSLAFLVLFGYLEKLNIHEKNPVADAVFTGIFFGTKITSAEIKMFEYEVQNVTIIRDNWSVQHLWQHHCGCGFCFSDIKQVKSKTIITGGQSFNPNSKNFNDQAEMYSDGKF